jgi:hypothetical protein
MPSRRMDKQLFWIKENSWMAKIAAWKLGSDSAAMVLGKTIHLHNISENDFLCNERLLKHEMCHVRQYQQHGLVGFLIKYILESVLNGYFHNKFEVEARNAENEST